MAQGLKRWIRVRRDGSGSEETAQGLRVPADLTEDLNLVTSIYIRWLTTTCSSSLVAPETFFWPYWAPCMRVMHKTVIHDK